MQIVRDVGRCSGDWSVKASVIALSVASLSRAKCGRMKRIKLVWTLPMSARLDILQKKPNKIVVELTEYEAKSKERRPLRRLPRGG